MIGIGGGGRAERPALGTMPGLELMAMGIHWPDLDEDLGIAGMLKGRQAG